MELNFENMSETIKKQVTVEQWRSVGEGQRAMIPPPKGRIGGKNKLSNDHPPPQVVNLYKNYV